MKLVIQSRQSLNELQDMVESIFSVLKSTSISESTNLKIVTNTTHKSKLKSEVKSHSNANKDINTKLNIERPFNSTTLVIISLILCSVGFSNKI